MEHCFQLNKPEYEKCKKFAEESSPSQREYRSGGDDIREVKQISDDTLRGKIAEVVSKKFLEQDPLNVTGIKLDFEVFGRGEWDESDFKISEKKISVKSSKPFARWLLLETKDLERGDTYDYYIFILVDEKKGTGWIKGFVSKEEMLQVDDKTLDLKKGDKIPKTYTSLDAANHARHIDNLHNSEEEWVELLKQIRG